jgi:transglutaminase-like putative cysteine protease
MLIHAGFTLEFAADAPTPTILTASVHPDRHDDLIRPDVLSFDPPVPHRDFRDSLGNVRTCLVIPRGGLVVSTDVAIHDTGLPEAPDADADQHPVDALPDDVLPFLLPSRFCDVEHVGDLARDIAGQETGWTRVQAICDAVRDRLRVDPADADPTLTAAQAWAEGRVVGRDFAHVAIALCRSLDVPARYCSGYLDAAGLALAPDPLDVASWFEAFLGGRWHAFDPCHGMPRTARILIARGRDAADVALARSYGPPSLTRFEMRTARVEGVLELPGMTLVRSAVSPGRLAAGRSASRD